MEIKRAIEFDGDIREKITELYVDGFYNLLKSLSDDKAKIIEAYSLMLPIEYFYVAIIDNEIAGMTACLGKGDIPLNIDRKIFTKYFGILRGLPAYYANKHFIKNMPIHEIDNETAIFEFVVTDSKYRGMGVASTLIKHIFALPEYKYFLIEVADTNPNAFELYKKLGFKEVHRKKSIPGAGINYWIHMEYSKE